MTWWGIYVQSTGIAAHSAVYLRDIMRVPISESDNNTIFLIPKYSQRLKTAVSMITSGKMTSARGVDMLKDSFQGTNWSGTRSNDLVNMNTFTHSVVSYSSSRKYSQ